MKNMFRNETAFNKIELLALDLVSDTWMCLRRGEGEKEIWNQGWSRVLSFSQETRAIGQRTPRIGSHEPKLKVHRMMNNSESSAGCTRFSDSTPLFFSLGARRGCEGLEGRNWTGAVL
jgi:hypothetical protein